MTPLRATYRLQFHAGFGFNDAAAIAPYLARLGVSHVYASPYLKARPGSTHGYDITDHQALNPELGTEAEFAAMVRVLRDEGLGQILDFVPNHMGVGGADNPLWLDVLEWGRDSRYAGWFDIDWDPDRRYLSNKLLMPFLGDQYGVELRGGKLVLKYDEADGSLAVWAYDTHKLPICPLHYDRILGNDDAGLDRLSDLFRDLPLWRPQVVERARELKANFAAMLRENPESRAALHASVAALNADWQALDALIQRQHWRVAYYGVAGDDINYRRFFNINDLAGLRMELPAVFRHAHARVAAMIENGTLDGIRLDHVDGLFDPKQYFLDLRAASPRPFYLVVEKILAEHEQLREDWPVDGTTGYDFTNLVLGVTINPAGEAGLTETYHGFTGLGQPFGQVLHDCKIHVMDNEMASELSALGRDAGRVARQNPLTADFTSHILQRAIRQIVASFPVYRTYVDMEGSQTDADRRDLDWAVAQARRGDPNIDSSVFDFLHAALSADIVARPRSGFSRTAVLRFAMKLQQYSGPVMAKGMEDTAFYRYNRCVALNEVGGSPDRFGITVGAFHKANAVRVKRWPNAMLATATHDTKRGEDTRARLAVLSDVPEDWARHVNAWTRLLRARRGDIERTGPPDRNDEYLLYQLLVGSWPVEMLEEASGPAMDAYAARIRGTMEKSVREAKLHSSWRAPDRAYEQAMQSFAGDALDPGRSGFLADFLPFAQRVARLGMQNSLIQTVMKLTLPGVPDIYQGCELWDLSLVDPDNRRPVDFQRRDAALADLLPQLGAANRRGALLSGLLEHWKDGRIKLAITALLLSLRRDRPTLFAEGDYVPLEITGSKADRALGYSRHAGDQSIVVAVARFPGLRESDPNWADTAAALPDGRWQDCLTGRTVAGGPEIALGELFADLPAIVLQPA